MEHPTPCDAAELSAVLAAAARPDSRLIMDRPIDPVPGPAAFTTAKLWWLQLWHDTDRLAWTMAAQAPDGRTWDHGCQRQWTTTGDVIEPLDALSPLERCALRERLLRAVSWPVPEQSLEQAVLTLQPPAEEPKPVRRRGRGGKR